MSLHQIQAGTHVTVRSTGDVGSIKEVYYFPTMYKVELDNGAVEKFTTHEIDIEGTSLAKPGIIKEATSKKLRSGKSYEVSLLNVKTVVWQEIKGDISDVWKRLISLNDYHLWYPGIQRMLPLNDMGRYVHQYSFDQFDLKPGSHVRTRSNSLFPFLNGRIMAMEKEKQFTLFLRINPMLKELTQFELVEKDGKILVTCTRSYKGLFSLLGYWGFHKEKSLLLKDFQELFFPIIIVDEKSKEEKTVDDTSAPSMDRETTIAYAVNKGILGDMDFINSIPDKPTRGLAKAALIKAKRTGIIPPMPDITPEKDSSSAPKPKTDASGIPIFEDTQDLIHYAVNLALDGNMDVINGIADKPTRGKAKAMMVKTKRSGERPPMPEMPVQAEPPESSGVETSSPQFESTEDLIHFAVNKALDGDMEFINSIEDKPTRGKAKAMMVKSKRSGERPPMPELPVHSDSSKKEPEKAESEEELMKRLIADGVHGNMEEINALDNRVLRGKIKAAVIREKRKSAG
jgi:hypothetical protein